MAVATSILLPSSRFPLNPLECMLTKIPPITPLNLTLTNPVLHKSFVFHSYKKTPGGWVPRARAHYQKTTAC